MYRSSEEEWLSRSRRKRTLARLDGIHLVFPSSYPSPLLPLRNRLVTTFWLRNDRVTRRLKTSKPQGLTRHLVHTPTRRCLLFVLHLHLHLLVSPCLPFTSYCSYNFTHPPTPLSVFSLVRLRCERLRQLNSFLFLSVELSVEDSLSFSNFSRKPRRPERSLPVSNFSGGNFVNFLNFLIFLIFQISYIS